MNVMKLWFVATLRSFAPMKGHMQEPEIIVMFIPILSWACLCPFSLWNSRISCPIFLKVSAYYMEQSPSSKSNRFSIIIEIIRILWKKKVHFLNHKCPPPIYILCQINPNYAPTLLLEDPS